MQKPRRCSSATTAASARIRTGTPSRKASASNDGCDDGLPLAGGRRPRCLPARRVLVPGFAQESAAPGCNATAACRAARPSRHRRRAAAASGSSGCRFDSPKKRFSRASTTSTAPTTSTSTAARSLSPARAFCGARVLSNSWREHDKQHRAGTARSVARRVWTEPAAASSTSSRFDAEQAQRGDAATFAPRTRNSARRCSSSGKRSSRSRATPDQQDQLTVWRQVTAPAPTVYPTTPQQVFEVRIGDTPWTHLLTQRTFAFASVTGRYPLAGLDCHEEDAEARLRTGRRMDGARRLELVHPAGPRQERHDVRVARVLAPSPFR